MSCGCGGYSLDNAVGSSKRLGYGTEESAARPFKSDECEPELILEDGLNLAVGIEIAHEYGYCEERETNEEYTH